MNVRSACPACDEPIIADDDFCEQCGHRLDGTIVPSDRCTWCQGSLTEGFCDQCGMRQRTEREHAEVDFGFAVAVTDRGLRYSRNEDAQKVLAVPGRTMEDPPTAVAAVVSDGVSASPRPDEAAAVATRRGCESLAAATATGRDPKEATFDALNTAAAAVAGLAESVEQAPACTYVSALVSGGTESSPSITIGWIGDSRAYWLPEDPHARPRLLTRDDSWHEYMVSSGRLTEEQASASANAHALIAWLGADAVSVDAHVVTFTPPEAGALVLCSDGLWNYLPTPEELHAAIPDARSSPRDSARSSVNFALEKGGHDNITVVIVPVPTVPPSQGES
ncbi:protein phosphatase 2C domain-containing protein [Spiractinospora alimapuensis]|uniref:PP2C family serine/threonine-protein phosphatase n=1 Tax=Spiractinospora alimapuensis TaxID=2820884 RepID=UPI001F45997A|nr:protein phosphatase 2C domain-containing protein [Spiractinospora alimapuensis]QVQ52012.1 protein phosphatase 2C domain-containing protein [Spiractinospora alimapuensis]